MRASHPPCTQWGAIASVGQPWRAPRVAAALPLLLHSHGSRWNERRLRSSAASHRRSVVSSPPPRCFSSPRRARFLPSARRAHRSWMTPPPPHVVDECDGHSGAAVSAADDPPPSLHHHRNWGVSPPARRDRRTSCSRARARTAAGSSRPCSTRWARSRRSTTTRPRRRRARSTRRATGARVMREGGRDERTNERTNKRERTAPRERRLLACPPGRTDHAAISRRRARARRGWRGALKRNGATPPPLAQRAHARTLPARPRARAIDGRRPTGL